MRNLPHTSDVLIIGAGLTGLALADHLIATGREVLEIEARSDVGGRVLSVNYGGQGFDLGPSWYWPEQPKMAALVKRFGLTCFNQHSGGDTLAEDREGLIQRGQGFGSMQGALRIDGGMGQVVNALADAVGRDRIFCDTEARSISDGDQVTVICDTPVGEKSVTAEHVVLALPPRLMAQSIGFVPPLLDATQKAAHSVPTWMAWQAKILAIYDRPIWRDAGLSGDALSRRGPMVEIHDASPAMDGPYALFGFVGFLPDIRNQYGDAILDAARDQLQRLFGPAAGDPAQLVLQDWAFEDLTATDADQAPLQDHPEYGRSASLGPKWGGKLHFASSELSIENGGLLEGALETAADVAAAILST